MNLTDIITPQELRAFIAEASVRQNTPEAVAAWNKRAERLRPLMEIFVKELVGAPEFIMAMLAFMVCIDEVLEHATKGQPQ